jgi:tetratricopeptide (TPR) repeat protein
MSADQLKEQGIQLFHQKEYEEAARIFQQAYDAYVSEDKADMAAEMNVNLGLVRRSMGEHQQALDLMQSALSVFEASGDTLRRAMVLGNLGSVYKALNDKEQALNCFREAADLFEELGQKKMHGETLLAIADLQMSERKINQAAATYEAGLGELDQLSGSQKILKGLIGIKNRLTGGGSGSSS